MTKKKSSPKTKASPEKAKAASDALEKRIANRKAAAKPDLAPAAAEAAEALPFEPNVGTPVQEPKAKKERKPRTPKAATAPSEELKNMLDKVRAKAVKEIEKKHKAEIKQLKTDHAREVKQMVDTDYHEAELKKAYAAGLKDGEKKAHADIKAALKATV